MVYKMDTGTLKYFLPYNYNIQDEAMEKIPDYQKHGYFSLLEELEISNKDYNFYKKSYM